MKKCLNNILIKTIIISLVLFFLLLFCYLFFLKDYSFDVKKYYIPTKKRNNYVITNDTCLNKYISKNKNTLIVFWATWCPSCIEESNDLNEFITNNPDIPVIVVSHDKNIENVEKYLKENNYNWFVILDSNRELRKNIDTNTKGIPATYLLDKDLNILLKDVSKLSKEDFFNFYNLNFNK